MTSYKDKEIRLNYNSDNQSLPTNWKNIFSHLGKICSLTSAQNFLSKALLCTLLMFMGVNGVWGQDYSGTYYIGTNGYKANSTANNFYLCPTEGWCYYQATDDFTGTDNGMPFLTTHKCRDNEYNVIEKAVWFVEKHPTQDYYYIKRAFDGKYVVLNGQIKTTPNNANGPNRLRVHIEALDNPDDKALFALIPKGTAYNIKPKTLETYLTVNGGNDNSLTGVSGKADGPTGYTNTKGIIGIYPTVDGNSNFYLEKAISINPPTITNNETVTNTFTITAAEGATIYYTTNGDTPTTSTPTNGTTSVNITQTEGMKVIKAIAKATNDPFSTPVVTYNVPACERPSFKVSGENVTITCATQGATIHYTTDGNPATTSSTTYSDPFPKTGISTIRAIATKAGYLNSSEAILLPPTEVSSSTEIVNMSGNYILTDNFTLSASIGTANDPFKGTIDGQFNHYTFNKPLVLYADGATIRNIILTNATLSNNGNTDHHLGAIACTATGDTRIYNCGILAGELTESGHVGGIVGHLDGRSRVINCYSYANITGGGDVGGIVGYNAFASTAEDCRTMVMNCMFYGDITGGTNVSPVYGGLNISNGHGGLNTYNYYAYDQATTFAAREDNNTKKYNNALAVEDIYLKRFEMYRLLLNSNKRLAAFYATGDMENTDEMAKWVLETSDRSITNPKPYPVLKAQGYYPSIINYDTENAPDSATVERNHGGKLGRTLTVHIGMVGSNAPSGAKIIRRGAIQLERTDKDFDRFNYNYDKVQLPYYNDVGTGNYTENKVVTGWKITSITGGTEGTFETGDKWNGYNFADRNCTKKDLYSVSGRVFAQGAYFDVPYGVTAITIEPYWGKAAYVADEYLDVVYNTSYSAQPVSGLDKQFPDGKITINGSEQTVYTSISAALNNLKDVTNPTVYDYAVVLVGNLHQNTVPSNGTKPFTIMSADLNHDNEPDYSMIYHHNNRLAVCPIRFDFLNIPGTAQAQKPNGASTILNFTIFLMKGWFEITNTCIVYSNQVEYENTQDNKAKAANSPLILLGGNFEQFVSTRASEVLGKTNYIHVGSNVFIKNFGMGTHSDGNKATPHIPVSVTGGEYEGFYLSGTYNPNAATNANDHAECYISSGHFIEAAGAAQEQIDGNVHWQIYNADIDNFYGGGINDTKPIKGTITTDIFNSYVGTFCGGPKFGNMQTGKVVTTNAEGCTFNEYFGAGYGGLSYSRQKYYDESSYSFSKYQNTYNGELGKYYDGNSTDANKDRADYGKKGKGVATDYDYEFFVWSTGVAGARFFVKFATFSLAQCENVESNLKNCIINKNFYGGGKLGNVSDKATSVLDGCTVHGNVFGGGYSADIPKIPVRKNWFATNPKFNPNTGIFEKVDLPDPVNYDWKHVADLPTTEGAPGTEDDKYVLTDVNLNALGKVGYTDLTVKGNTKVEGKTFDANGDEIDTPSGGVFGGGDMSAVNHDTKVKIEATATEGVLNVFGGGNTADVDGDAVVMMSNGTVSNDIYGGGKGATTTVGGDVTVHIGKTFKEDGTTVDLTGTPTITGSVYGGSAFGAVNATKGTTYNTDPTDINATSGGKETKVNIYAGTINESVYGGGKGQVESGTSGQSNYQPAYAAQNFGNTTVNVENGTIKTAVYGGSNANGVLKGDATVTITGGIVGKSESTTIDNTVFGGGYGKPTLVNGSVTVNIGREKTGDETDHVGTATIHGNVYGGGALGSTNGSVSNNTFTPTANKNTTVNLYKGTIKGNVFGGGLGQQAAENVTAVAATVGGDVTVTLDGAELVSTYTTGENPTPISGQIFGCNNLNGTPLGHVKVHVKRTVGSEKDGTKSREARTPTVPTGYDVAAVYGGGNQADYIPTNATLVTDSNAEGYDAGNPAKVAAACAEVLIEGCQKASINYVYGGGNAAAVPATKVTVLGTYIINTLYGGGNGSGDGNPGANVGIYKVDNISTDFGTGKAETMLYGGYINNVYGGSNTKGDVRGGTDVRTKERNESAPTEGDCCSELKVGKVYGAGSHADMAGDVNVTLECMPDDYVAAVYGGAELATVNGDVQLTVTSGKFGRVFGGNNEGGDIHGSITVNVYEDGCKPLIIGELYGGGNAAPYSIYGCTKGTPWTANSSGTLYFDEIAKGRAAIQVNVYACTSVGKVFGGGMGSTAKVIGNTHVWINPMKGVVDTNGDGVGELQPTIGKVGQVFGGGGEADVKGDTRVDIGTSIVTDAFKGGNGALIASGDDYLNPESNTTTSITAGVYGGGYSADVDGSATLNIGTMNLELGTSITGDIFGGGYGEKTTVTGSVTVNIGADTGTAPAHNYVGYANITGDVYGGSAKGKVNATKDNDWDANHLDKVSATAGKETQVNFYGGSLSGTDKGNIYGGGLGVTNSYAADVFGPVTVTMGSGTVNNVFGCNNVLGTPKNSVIVNINGGTVNNSVYGGGNQAAYTPIESTSNYPAVNIINGTVNENVFGGGLGETATATSNPNVTIGDNVEGHVVAIKKSVYGGGELATVDGSTYIVVNSGTIGTPKDGETVYGGPVYGNIYGGGFGNTENPTAGLISKNTNITVSGGNIYHNIYGGGAYGSVGSYTFDSGTSTTTCENGTGTANITIIGGTIGTDGHENGMVFGASRGDVAAPDAVHDRLAWVNNTNVIIGTAGQGPDAPQPQIKGSVYGGGENGHTYHDTHVTINSGRVGITDKNIDGGAAYAFRGNVYGGGCGTDKYDSDSDNILDAYNPLSGIVNGTTHVEINGGHVVRDVYGAGAMGSAVVGTNVTINGGEIGAQGSGGGYVFAAARGDEALTDANQSYVGNTSLTIAGGTIWQSAFGGGQSGIVKGNVAVTVSGGEVKNDVYGGGALANTNTDNWDATNNRWSNQNKHTYYAEVKHLVKGSSSVEGYFIRIGGAGTQESPYTYDNAHGTAVEHTKYYKKLENFLDVAANGTTYKTSVSLTGGTIGNAYGGGLGRFAQGATPAVYTAVADGTTLTLGVTYYTSDAGAGEFTSDGTEVANGSNYYALTTPASPAVEAVEAMVYGDVSVTVDGTKFTKETERVDGKTIPITGRVFGCNNKNGTPKGSVNVLVNQTKRLDGTSDHVKNQFEIQGVYGGGNMANYTPDLDSYDIQTEFGRSTHVLIKDCGTTSIERVYGGGNASSVPFTDVVIEGSFQIGYVFGGGNGGDKINKGTGAGWEENLGADVTNYTNVLLKGGTIGDAFGGSDSKGTVGNTELTKSSGSCALVINNVYGASKEADSDGDVILNLSGCGSGEVDKVFGGSYNANVHGSVTINITSGIYTSVYGGNDRKGSVGGNITINIEEVDECNPIIIQNLFGGGSLADYPGVDAKRVTNAKDENGYYTGEGVSRDPVTGKYTGLTYADVTSGTLTLNIKAATRIDRIFGGCDNAKATGNTEVNINMVKGSMAGKPFTLPATYTGDPIPTVHAQENYVEVTGLTVGTSSVSGYYERSGTVGSYSYTLTEDTKAQDGKTYCEHHTHVVDDKIGTIGNVYGGGNEGDVDGNTTVNIGNLKDVAFEKTPGHLTPNGNSKYDVLGAHIYGEVFGGGNEGNVTGNTTVNIGTADYSDTGDFEGIFIDKNASDKGGTVYGGGNQADVLGNTYVTMSGGNRDDRGKGVYVFNGVFGGGYAGSVGTYPEANRSKNLITDKDTDIEFDHSTHTCLGKPTVCAENTGKCTVVVSGGQIGPIEVATLGMKRSEAQGGPVPQGWVWGGGCGRIEDPEKHPDTHFKTYVGSTDVTISGTALIMESVIGGGEFGRVLGDTKVTISGGQIGVGANQTVEVDGIVKPKRYTDDQWTAAATAVTSGNATDINNAAALMPECSHFDYGYDNDNDGTLDYLPYDPYYDKYYYDKTAQKYKDNIPEDLRPAITSNPSDGKTWIGCVFGGGSGYMPYEKEDGTGYDWCRSAGWVEGDTEVIISGGHILTNVYGGNEYTDVGTPGVANTGKCTVKMSGGTIGVPRTLQQIADHPVTCYLFGGGKGDERTHFDQFTNVNSVEVEVSGGIIYGSVFGGAEDGHVLGDAKVVIKDNAKIGTWGTSYVDGNVFGGGRGFSGKNLIAGGVGGNTQINITGGTMLGSIYGGGRLASVGIDLDEKIGNDSYGQLIDETGSNGEHGHITIDIRGGKIGTTTEAGTNHPVGGNVFGGSMGRTTLLDGSTNPMWPKMAVAKLTKVDISGGEIMNNVYGGSEYGIVRNRATVNILPNATPANSPVIHGHVFGGGYGSDGREPTTIRAGGYSSIPSSYYTFTPMTWTGCVSGDTNVNISGGKVEKNVYGGGEYASVGLINFNSKENGTYNYITKHESLTDGFGLSWPYKFQYITAAPNDAESVGGNKLGGKTTVNITGGHIGSTTWDDRTGYVFGGSKGQVAFKKKVKNGQNVLVEVDITDIHEQRYTEAFCANVRETEVNINYDSTPTDKTPSNIGAENNCIMGAVYGGGEDGHVYENTAVNITGGLIGLSVYGGGKGEGTYSGKLYALSTDAQGNLVAANTKSDVPKMPSWTAGKVYGNTSISMSNGHVMGNVYGGGNLGSVGKGNYAGGTDDYYPAGYGETLQNAPLWTKTSGFNPDAPITESNKPTSMADYFLSSGKCKINITGGTVGTLNGLYGNVQGTSKGTPTGIVFGGSRGRAARDVGALSPRYEYAPDFFLGYCNNTEVTIGTRNAATGPTIYSQVFGGGRDGHVRGSAKVEVNAGTIGQTYDETQAVGDADVDYQRYHRGNVYGSGSGLGTWDGTHHGTSSGSVTRNTTVDIYGGTIYNNVYGGGAMACVGPPRIPPTADIAPENWSKCTVNIYGGTIGSGKEYESVYMSDFDKYGYGGCVYGASRGSRGGNFGDLAENESIEDYATVLWTEVNIKPHPSDRDKDAVIAGNVYGGAQGGQVKQDTKVNLTGGVIKHDAYGGGQGTTDIAANVLGNTTVELNNNNDGGDADGSKKGCIIDKVFGCNDLNGTPKGHVLVHVYATQNASGGTISDKTAFPPAYSAEKSPDEGYITFMTNLIHDVTQEGGIAANDPLITTAQATITGKTEGLTDPEKTAILTAAKAIDVAMNSKYDSYGYDVTAVYGGGDLAIYDPDDHEDKTEVIIEGCGTTSIKQVYGGGNAAPVSATDVTVKSCYIIGELFGGGNGKDNYQLDGKWYENPGANVGYTQMSHYITTAANESEYETYGKGDVDNPFKAIENKTADGYLDATTPDNRRANYSYGTGVATSTINGGHVHKAYGGSNEKGNISGKIESELQQMGSCTIVTDGTYGGSKTADTDATINVVLDCVENGGTFYGGSYKANIYSDVNIHITNGTYSKVFGGNDRAGTINGKITITIEEYGCTPIKITELYAGGNLAPYSVYGYKTETKNAMDADGNDLHDVDENGNPTNDIVQQRIPYRAGEIGARPNPYWDPRINIISATKIDAIYGGGYGAGATMIGNPHVNVNMTEGKIRSDYKDYKESYATDYPLDSDGNRTIPIGTIGTIYGGGNLASVEGDTYLEIGTGQWIASWDDNGNPVWESTNDSGDKYSYKEKTAAVYYTQAECDTYNSNPANNVTGYITSGKVLTAEEATAVNKTLGTSYVEGAELMTKDANAYNAKLSGARLTSQIKTGAVYYTQEEIDAAQEGDPAYGKTTSDIKTPAVYYTQAECDEYNKSIEGYIAKHTKLTAAQANSVNTALTPSYNTNDAITAADANAYNATLPNARKTTDVKTAAVWAWYDEDGTEMTTAPTLAPRNAATITGNVFGGGKGEAKTGGEGAFQCAKGMIGVDGDGIDYPEGGTSVIIANGTIGTIENEKLKAGTGNVYGGGELGRVEKNTIVTIGMTPEEGETLSNTKFKPTIWGSVFGAGKGVDTHGYSALVRGNSNVTIQGFAKVGESVYGGGEIASIGRYNVVDGIPTSLKNENSGNCIVTVLDNAEIGPDNMTMFHVDAQGNIVANDEPDNSGHVFGAGKGAMPVADYTTAQHMTDGNSMAGFESEEKYLKFIETLGLATHTDVTIGGNAFVKGDVFGGAEQGFVQHDTHVTIEGDCQIGNGYVQMNADGSYKARTARYSLNRRYTATEWTAGKLEDVDGYGNSLPECASWEYGQASGAAKYAAHDIYAGATGYDSKGGSKIADNGSTFYGNVFGGGSGYFPYAAGKWHWKAGDVGGNTLVEIKGGHILTNVYGGNELTNVAGKCTINMTGGTIGVPRTLDQIKKHPVTCYLFGGGKGDPRVLFNKQTNVQDVEVIIEGGWIYGSAFGGGEDGHVMRNVTMNISSKAFEGTPAYADYYAGNATKIGTWGTSYVDGNVFGGGRGFAGDAYTAGNVAGSVNLTISGGTMLGSIYGGGRLGSVGYGLYEATETDKYGTMRPDNYADDGTTEVANFKRGYVTMNISGGTIGNDYENVIPSTADNTGAGITADKAVANWDATDWEKWKAYKHIPYTDFVYDDALKLYRLSHTKGGNVFAGSMGRRTQLDGTSKITAVDWMKLGAAKSTKLTITGGTIKSNVYGGGEFGAIRSYVNGENVQGGTTTIDIQGGTIGTEIKETVTEGEEPNTTTTEVTRYTFGSVYGGGYGTEAEIGEIDEHNKVNKLGALVDGNTTVSMSDGHVWASVFGGGEVAAVGGNTNVTISGGEIGKGEVKPMTDTDPGYVMFGGATMGNVYGGGKGNKTHTLLGVVKGNTIVTINAGTVTGEPFIYHNVYGGGALGSVGTFTFSDGVDNLDYVPKGNPLEWEANTGKATINITGGTIGISGRDNGMVNGSSRGDIAKPIPTIMGKKDNGDDNYVPKDPYDKMAWVNITEVNIGTQNDATAGPHIKGSVYGGGENGHVFHLATVNVKSGTIGVVDEDETWYSFIPKNLPKTDPSYATYEAINEKAWVTRGNVYGAGCGTDTYTDDNGKELHNPWAGCVVGNTEVNISGGLIAQSVYGGGSMGSVGSIKNDPSAESQQHKDLTNGFALSWPAVLEYQDLTDKTTTGRATINITGGRIGTTGSDNGDVFGGTRGEAGDRYEMAQFANVKETVVNIDYKDANNDAYTPGDDKIEIYEKIDEDDDQLTFSLKLKDEEPGITGSVYGGCENGHVYKNTQVNIKNGFIGHAVYGGGKGKGKYIPSGESKKVHSITAGKVYGNTEVNMTGGRVLRNIYGGGNLGSIGKGNYAGGADDFYPAGYGEKITGDLWTTSANEANPDNAWYFLNSGIATVNVIGGIVGYMPNDDTKVTPCDEQGTPNTSSTTYKLASADANMKELLFNVLTKDDMPTGNVFGGCRGQATAEPGSMVPNSGTVDFFCGYVNETNVTIGQEAKDAVPESSPRIYGSVYGGGQDGHVRRSTNVSIKKGEIGIPYNDTYRTLIGTKDLTPEKELNNLNWLHRGNIYGGGSGIGKYEDSEKKMHNSSSAGSVTHTTTINVGNGITGVAGTQAAPGNVIYRNVYGGGSLASVIPPSLLFSSSTSEGPYADDNHGKGKMAVNTVNIAGAVGVIEGYEEEYGGEVYGAGRGDESVEHPEWFALSVWTKVHIMNGANIMGNVFGGGDAGVVKKDSEVIVGE